MKKISVGTRLYLSVVLLFLCFAAAFIVYQQQREKDYKIELLDTKLQDYNAHLKESLSADSIRSESALEAYVKSHFIQGLRVTLMQTNGTVYYDNLRKDYDSFPNHLDRKEVVQALKRGTGFDINRLSTTLNKDYFYAASYFAPDSLIVRSALPYTSDLTQQLRGDWHYVWFALITMLLLLAILYPFARRLNNDFQILYNRLLHVSKEQDKLKRELTQNVAHELKTPVASIQGYLETIIMNPEIDAQTREQFLRRSYAQTQRLTSLLQDIQTLNRMDAAPVATDFELIDILPIIDNIQKETALQFSEREMQFVKQIPPIKQLLIEGNASLIYSIFRNLIDNALCYAGNRTTVTLTIEKETERWHFILADNGVGVADEHLARLFERFYRVDKGRSRKMGGTGLGLAIVKNAVLLHNGTIFVKNNDGGGLRFDFYLPVYND